jgi:CubicO group peptidase (beta-lactamase class C family)
MFFPILMLYFFSCNSYSLQNNSNTINDTTYNGVYRKLTDKEKNYYNNAVYPLYQNTLATKGFSGGFVAAKNGEIVFEDYRGFSNYANKTFMDANTPLHLASISKTFTSMAVLHLMEQGKIDIDKNVNTYLTNFPYYNITVKDLLTHRSGLPNYVYFMEGKAIYRNVKKRNKRGKTYYSKQLVRREPGFEGLANNQDVLNWMVDKNIPAEGYPNRYFKYCNTNYVLLALIVEEVTEKTFPAYMKDSVFAPLGMNNTFVFNKESIANYVPSYQYNNVPYKVEKFDCVYGDKNVYSTPRDILLWDKALFSGQFVSKATQALAYVGYSNERRGEHNYGLGWRLIEKPEETIVYHNGWWHGNNTVFTRFIKDTVTIIALGNRYNRNIYKAKSIATALTGKADTTLAIE